MQRNVKAEITIVQLYLACLPKYQSLLCTAIPFLKFIVLEKCHSSLILYFLIQAGWEVRSFWTVWKSTWDISAASRGSLPASCTLSLLWTQRKRPPPGPALILTANIKRASVKAKTKNRTAQGCWAPVLLSREDQGSGRARDPVWSPCLIITDVGVNKQCWAS